MACQGSARGRLDADGLESKIAHNRLQTTSSCLLSGSLPDSTSFDLFCGSSLSRVYVDRFPTPFGEVVSLRDSETCRCPVPLSLWSFTSYPIITPISLRNAS